MRSAALARAEAQLASRRLSTRGPQGLEAPGGHASGGESSSSSSLAIPGLSAIRMASDLSDLSGANTGRDPAGWSPCAPPLPRRCLLKQQRQGEAAGGGRQRAAQAAGARGRACAVLQKLAQLESRIRDRKGQLSDARDRAPEEEVPPGVGTGEGQGRRRGAPGKEPPASEGTLSPWPLSRSEPFSSPPSLKGSPSPPTSVASSRRGPLSERIIIQSLDELFWEADTHCDASSGSSDFQVKVLSLEDLAPSVADHHGAPDDEGTPSQANGQLRQELGTPPSPTVFQSPFRAPSGSVGQDTALEEESPGATEISEQLSEEAVVGSAEYSEDFDSLTSPAAPESTGRLSSSSSSKQSCGLPEASATSSASSPPAPRRVMMKDATVQTSTPFFPHPWLQTDAPALLSQSGESPGPTLPIASHVVSLDAVEALTTYSPAVFVLNNLLKQNLVLIRQFAEASRRLHGSVVASLEEERFCYHSLEEAQKYIALHRPPPLTMEQALQKLEAQQEAF